MKEHLEYLDKCLRFTDDDVEVRRMQGAAMMLWQVVDELSVWDAETPPVEDAAIDERVQL